ncbi:MAG: Si-specific NAD(P)(+) transhydrogenase [Pseudomonadales bacterium]|nr:Si-specific NAD(P)(+) transhydrogenase [Gammaproteobacteria bacterium]NNL56197.1 Si-specific NAD(P)(+) transhydrogenase [Pseudomonadales bacterium]
MTNFDFDIAVIGSGPAGQKAAIQGAKAGKRVAMVESANAVGGHCVHRGTIPSKTLRQNAVRIAELRKQQHLFAFSMREDLAMDDLVANMNRVINSHDQYMQAQLLRNSIAYVHGRAKFQDAHTLAVERPGGASSTIRARNIIIATGSYPRHADNVPIDHEHIYDSDSILSMVYLPRSMTVLGGGVIASEYASIFLALGVEVTMIDKYPRPLGFLDPDLTDKFVHAFESSGGRWLGESEVVSVEWNGIDQVVTTLATGETVNSEKLLSAAGRVANVKGLDIAAAGLQLNERSVIDVNAACCTAVPNIFAAGDVIGPPSLASASMEQGRRASCSALGIDLGSMTSMIPMGIYAIPEMSSVGLTEQQAAQQCGSVLVGHANFEEVARGQISGVQDGMLKLVADAAGDKLLGVHIVGEGATELIHIGQMGLLNGATVDTFVENIFNFPTLAEAYRVAALDIVGQRQLIDLAS